jgi:hypothetical protein
VSVGGLALFSPLPAFAQTCPNIDIGVSSTVPRFAPGPETSAHAYPLRQQNLSPTWINYKDCQDDINLEFTLQIRGLPCTDTVQVWAGTVDCTQLAARQSDSGQTRCWPVAPPGAFSMSPTSTGTIRAQDVAEFLSSASPSPDYTRATQAACQSQCAPGGEALRLYFMAVEADGFTVDGTSAEYDFGANLVGPYRPSDVAVGESLDSLIVSWSPAADTTIAAFNIYCQDLAPEEGGVPGAGATVEGGVPGACESRILVDRFTCSSAPDASTMTGNGAAGISEVPSQYLCGQVGGATTSSFAVTGDALDGGPALEGRGQIAVGVAALDTTGNVGPLGNLVCAPPLQPGGFWLGASDAGSPDRILESCSYASASPHFGDAELWMVGIVSLVFVERRRFRVSVGAETRVRPSS